MSDASDASKKFSLLSKDTAESLKALAKSIATQDKTTNLSLPEINAAAELISQVAPAGNVPSLILSGLSRLAGRRPPPDMVKQDINKLFGGMDQALDGAVYGAFFAGPAAVIWAYQNLLKMAGKSPEESFPDGLWQFYVEYALREDTARHANETRGFEATLKQRNLTLTPPDRLAAWVMSAANCLHQYHRLLENEWRERVYCETLWEMHRGTPQETYFSKIYRKWEVQRPYGLPPDVSEISYPEYRRHKFDAFLEAELTKVAIVQRKAWEKRIQADEQEDLPLYLKQMSIRGCLEPNQYNEVRTPLPLGNLHIGVIIRGHYYLIPVCAPNSEELINVHTVRAQMAKIYSEPESTIASSLIPLAEMHRAAWPDVRPKFSEILRRNLDALRYAPIIINGDLRPKELPLPELRRAERGVGNHALTVFTTRETMVFDQSHIFFDGAWGAALAEMMTEDAIRWALNIGWQPPPELRFTAKPRHLDFMLNMDEHKLIATQPRRSPEACAETEEVNVQAILAQRKLFERYNDKLRLTVNDILVLYRAIHAATYKPSPELIETLQELAKEPTARAAVTAALDSIEATRQTNPAMLIPVDASQRSPRDRLQPMNFEVPLSELKLIQLHQESLKALNTLRAAQGEARKAAYTEFHELKQQYLGTLAAFGAVLSKAKEITLVGENATTSTMKLLAHIPAPLQKMLNQIPGRFDVLNDIIRGREVFSNTGAVSATSSLTRFLTAKDDNDKKTLAWGVLTDSDGAMRITLRDFRPHVAPLVAIGQQALANRITHEYLDAFARGVNEFIRDLRHIVLASQLPR